MKKTVLRIVSMILLINIVTFTSCQKDETADGITFRATMEDCTSSDDKTVLNGTHLYWSPGDQIKVFGSRPGRYGIFETRANHSTGWTEFRKNDEVGTGPFDGPYRAIYPVGLAGEDVTHIMLPGVQHSEDGILDHGFPMYAQTKSDVLNFKNICGVIRLSLYKPDVYESKPDVRVKAIKIVAGTRINGSYELSYDRHNLCPVITHADGGSNAMWFVCDVAQSISSVKDFYIFMPPGRYRNLKILILTDDGRYCEKTLKDNVVLNCYRSQTTDIILWSTDLAFVKATPTGVKAAPTDALPGYFSVSPTQQVRFALGNLEYQEGSDVWRFAETQLDEGGWFDFGTGYLPGYGRLGWYGNYEAWVGYNNEIPNEIPPFVDWGMNAISNGGNEPNAWRTLSIDEWDYLFHSRANASDKYGIAVVNHIDGMILLPDNWTNPFGLSFTPGCPRFERIYIIGSSEYYGRFIPQSYTLSQWSRMEANGAVFLPAGFYWSSSGYSSSHASGVYFDFIRTASYDGTNAYMNETCLFGVPLETDYHQEGCVRLVQNAE